MDKQANSADPYETPQNVESNQGLYCLNNVKVPTIHSLDKIIAIHSNLDIYTNIYILCVVSLDQTNISDCLHFSMQNIDMSCDLDRASRRSNVNVSQ